VTNLESTVKELEEQLREQELEADAAIGQWEETYSASEERCAELEEELALVKMEKVTTPKNNDADDFTLDVSLLGGSQIASEVFASGKDESGGVTKPEEKLRDTEQALHAATAGLARDGEILLQWQGKCAAMEEYHFFGVTYHNFLSRTLCLQTEWRNLNLRSRI
jgi:hypothetical protein